VTRGLPRDTIATDKRLRDGAVTNTISERKKRFDSLNSD